MSPMSLLMINGDGQQKELPDDDLLNSMMSKSEVELLEEIPIDAYTVDDILEGENDNLLGPDDDNNNFLGGENWNGLLQEEGDNDELGRENGNEFVPPGDQLM